MEKPIFVIGSGGYCKQVIEILENTSETEGWQIKGLIDDDIKKIGQKILGYPVLGDTQWLKERSLTEISYAVLTIGDGDTRKKIVNQLNNVYWPNIIHPAAVLSKYIKVGEGNIISAGVIINPDSVIGDFNNINIGSTLGHDVDIADFVTIMPNCSISGNVKIDQLTMVGTGTAVIQELKIGRSSIIGAGSSVINHVDSFAVYAGSPAKKLKSRIREESEGSAGVK